MPIVLGIWGYVIYQIVSVVGHKDVTLANNITVHTVLPEKNIIDTFSIVANYRDPFLGKMTLTPSENDKPKIPVKKIEKPVEPVRWPSVVYHGMIKNQKTNKELYLVTINNQDNMMKPGDVFSDVELKKVYKDSILVIYKKEIKTFRK